MTNPERSEYLRQSIAEQTAELQRLESVDSEARRTQANRATLENYRKNVEQTRKDHAKFEEAIVAALAALRTAMPDVHHVFCNVVQLRPEGQVRVDALVGSLRQALLAEYRHSRQLVDAEARLQAMEVQFNPPSPPKQLDAA